MSHDKILQTYNDIKHHAERLASRDEFPALVSRRLAIIENNWLIYESSEARVEENTSLK